MSLVKTRNNKDIINNNSDKDSTNSYHFCNTHNVPATYNFQLQNNFASWVLLTTTLETKNWRCTEKSWLAQCYVTDEWQGPDLDPHPAN